jgi:hypothetical protein
MQIKTAKMKITLLSILKTDMPIHLIRFQVVCLVRDDDTGSEYMLPAYINSGKENVAIDLYLFDDKYHLFVISYDEYNKLVKAGKK